MYTITDKYKLLFSLTPLLIQEQPGHLPPLQPGTCWPLFTIREVTLEVNFVPVKISCRCCCSGGNVEITWPQEMGDNKSSFLFLQTANTAFLDHSACAPYLWLALLLILSLKAMRKYTWTTSAFLHLYSTYRGYITALGGLIFMKTTGSPFHSMHIVLQTNGGKGDNAVFLSRPDKSGRARISGHLGKITRITPGFLWFCPDFCDLVHVQSIMELFAKRQNNGLNVP